ncbi:hypothetical protein V6N11_004813 [Hibiscus sabdariffa]|uniref:RNase H type-1 domain-containing protein n=1 Tax=Hibiscus sabdariffa TaxID=183260 RepID=A0ABR2SHF1_9ROSI
MKALLGLLRSLFWLNDVHDDWNFYMEGWWQNPISILTAIKPLSKNLWCPSITGWLKFNIGAAVKGPKVGCGGVLRDDSGSIRALFSGPVEGADMDVARILAISYALELFCEINWGGIFGLLVELDSQVVLNWITKPNHRPWKWWHKLVSVDLLIKRAGMVEFKIVHQQCNALAFGLARDGASRDSFFKAWW